jgi:hypothetical protein
MARRDDREYREYLREEQRRQPRGPQRGSRVGVEEGCPAREVVLDQRGQATRPRDSERRVKAATPLAATRRSTPPGAQRRPRRQLLMAE